jgi:hypothetical protein
MNFDDFLLDQEIINHVKECKDEIIGTLTIVNVMLVIAGSIIMCSHRNANARIEKLEQRNRTLKEIIFSAMESGIIRMMGQTQENSHED